MTTTVRMRIGNITYEGQTLVGGSEVDLPDGVAASWIAAGIAEDPAASGAIPQSIQFLPEDSRASTDPPSAFPVGESVMHEYYVDNGWPSGGSYSGFVYTTHVETEFGDSIADQEWRGENGKRYSRIWAEGSTDWTGWSQTLTTTLGDNRYVEVSETNLDANAHQGTALIDEYPVGFSTMMISGAGQAGWYENSYDKLIVTHHWWQGGPHRGVQHIYYPNGDSPRYRVVQDDGTWRGWAIV